MKILLLGKDGQVGYELQRTLAPLGDVIALGRKDLDLLNTSLLRQTIRETKPGLLINAAAYTAVDKAEEEQELAAAINTTAPAVMAEEAKKLGVGIIHFSTDYVFDGTKNTPYLESDKTNPINVYGKTKLEGETSIQALGVPHFIFRTSWVYALRGKNFLLTILRLAHERDKLTIVDDQTGSPTWSRMIAEITSQIVSQGISDPTQFLKEYTGIYHLTSSGQTTWCQFAKTILDLDLNKNQQTCKAVFPISTSEYPTPAARPQYSVLDNKKQKQAFQVSLPTWDKALELSMAP